MLNSKAPLYVKKLNSDARVPTKGSSGAAGYDIYSSENTVVPARGKAIVKTGIAIAVPTGNYGRVAPRSGLAVKNFIDTGAGVIDEDYRGEVGVVLFNHSEKDFEVKIGDRVAQLIIEKITDTQIIETEELDDTLRGAGGFGSTGVREIIQSDVKPSKIEKPFSNEEKRNATDAGLVDHTLKSATEELGQDDDQWKEFCIINLVQLFEDGKISLEDKKKLANLVFQDNKAIFKHISSLREGKSTIEELIALGNL